MKKLTAISLAALAILWPAVAFGGDNFKDTGTVSASGLGFASAQDLADTPATATIRMDGDAGHFSRLTLVFTITWGTTATASLTCKVSSNGTNYGWIQRCTDASPHNCAPRQWDFQPADGTEFALDMEANYPYMICQFDDALDGTGTIMVRAIRGL